MKHTFNGKKAFNNLLPVLGYILIVLLLAFIGRSMLLHILGGSSIP